jgi:hypothetical protein
MHSYIIMHHSLTLSYKTENNIMMVQLQNDQKVGISQWSSSKFQFAQNLFLISFGWKNEI